MCPLCATPCVLKASQVSCCRPTLYFMLEVIELWTRILDAGGVVDAIYFDFAKAFDTTEGEVASQVLCPWDPNK